MPREYVQLFLESDPTLPEPDQISGAPPIDPSDIIPRDQLPTAEELMADPDIADVVNASLMLIARSRNKD